MAVFWYWHGLRMVIAWFARGADMSSHYIRMVVLRSWHCFLVVKELLSRGIYMICSWSSRGFLAVVACHGDIVFA
eukprot:7890055-Pyramimonas_sp.AAC.1